MSKSQLVDGALVEWGARLFYPGNRIVHARTPRLALGPISASMIRERIEATVRRAPQVMVGGVNYLVRRVASRGYVTRECLSSL